MIRNSAGRMKYGLRSLSHQTTAQNKGLTALQRYADLFVESNMIQKINPRSYETVEEFQQNFPGAVTQDPENVDLHSINQSINMPMYDLLDRGGKKWRPSLGLIFAELFGRNDLQDFERNKDIYFACGMTEIVHNGTLICDDVEDQSLKRRGDLCTYRKYGVDYAVNTGNFMYFSSLNKIEQFIP